MTEQISTIGYIKTYRARYDHDLFRGEKFCKLAAWDWLCSMAAWKPTKVNVGGKTIVLERGQLCYSVRYMATAWGWSKSTVGRFLTRLETETMIGTKRGTEDGTGGTSLQLIITICNCNKYQDDEREIESEVGQDAGCPTGQGVGQERDK